MSSNRLDNWIIAPSILSADFTKLGQELNDVEKGGADWIHIDVMDGHFVPNISYGPIIVEACKKATNLILDVHLMIEKPDLLIPEFAKAGADLISVHAEACTHLHRTIQLIKSLDNERYKLKDKAKGVDSSEYKEQDDTIKEQNKYDGKKLDRKIKAGVALNPATPLSAIEWIIDDIDFVLIMSVNPGFGGQKFINSTIDKIAALSAMLRSRGSNAVIQVDGGIAADTICKVAFAGATSFVAGSAIFKTADYKDTISMFRKCLDNLDRDSLKDD